jgi:hypothetical protein
MPREEREWARRRDPSVAVELLKLMLNGEGILSDTTYRIFEKIAPGRRDQTAEFYSRFQLRY